MHAAEEEILTGKDPAVDKDISPAVEAFRKFVDEKNIQVDPEYVERRLVNYNDRYAGTVDSVALIDGKLGVLDIKTSSGIYKDYTLQLAAYFPPLQELLRGLSTRWILRIDQDQICNICGATKREKGGRVKVKAPYPSNGINSKLCDHEWSEVRGITELKEFPYWQDDYQAFLGAKKLWEWDNISHLKKIGYL